MELRVWDASEHLRHIDEGEWLPMYGPDGAILPGIEGKQGVRGVKSDGTHIGCDFIRMQPGSQFDLHVHEGDHEIYFISGSGFVHIDGQDIFVSEGHLIHIPGEYPHGIWVWGGSKRPLIFAPTGHPHQPVHSHDRMRLV